MNRPTRCVCFACCLFLFTAVASPADEPAESRPNEKEGGQPPAMVALDLWVVTLEAPDQKAENEEVGHLLSRVANLPTVVGQREDVRALIGRLESQGIVRGLQEFRLTTLDRRRAEVAVGESQPRITASALTKFGTTNSILYEPLGTQVQLAPHIEADGSIRVNVNIQTNDLGEPNKVAISVSADGESLFAPEIVSLNVKTGVRVTDGKALLISGPFYQSQAKTGMRLVIFSAEVVKSNE